MTTRIDWNIAKRSILERVLHLTKEIFLGHSIRFCSEHRVNQRCRSLHQSMRFQTLLLTYPLVKMCECATFECSARVLWTFSYFEYCNTAAKQVQRF